MERFAALADPTDNSDWLDVRSRARRRRVWLVAPVAAAAAVVAAAAVAAGGGWIFSTHDRQVTARTEVTLAGRTWRVSYTASPKHGASFCARASSAGTATQWNCREMGPGSPRLGPPFGALKLTVPAGQIWVGATVGFTRRIAITDTNGHVHATRVVKAPRGMKTPFRYWVIALDGTTAQSIAATGMHGRVIRKTLH
jgi:hypothetical protein